jgi:hypothetical protein
VSGGSVEPGSAGPNVDEQRTPETTAPWGPRNGERCRVASEASRDRQAHLRERRGTSQPRRSEPASANGGAVPRRCPAGPMRRAGQTGCQRAAQRGTSEQRSSADRRAPERSEGRCSEALPSGAGPLDAIQGGEAGLPAAQQRGHATREERPSASSRAGWCVTRGACPERPRYEGGRTEARSSRSQACRGMPRVLLVRGGQGDQECLRAMYRRGGQS